MRATVVQGMLLTTVTSLAVSVVERWTAMPSCLRLERPGTVTSILVAAGWPELVQRGGGAVREDRAGTAREHRRHPEALALEERPRDQGVDAVWCWRWRRPGGGALLDRAVHDRPQAVELVESEHAVLLAGERREAAIHTGLARESVLWVSTFLEPGSRSMP